MMKIRLEILATLFGVSSALGLPADQLDFFESKIRPVLAESCYECHNSVNKKKAGLALDYRDALLAGGENGEVLIPGDPEASVLIWAIRHEEDLEMPSKSPKLADSVVEDFEEWIRMGAPDPRLKKPTQLDLDNAVSWSALFEKRRQWWSFQPLGKSKPPTVDNAEWNRNPIDRFVYDRFDKQGLEAEEEATPEVLVRRLHLMLTGLPPKREASEAFARDPSPEAYGALVDALLDLPEYGERWARYWMDWYRFAESHGSEGDPKLNYASVYRDYLIRALNDDVPYDQLLREHLAGDLMEHPRLNEQLGINESAIGPAHLRMVPHGFGVTDAYAEQITFTDNQIDVVSKAMLGVTVSCARCHNHKFDPISQKDFYRLYGIMVSNRPGTINIDTAEKQDLHKQSLSKLKQQIRKRLADYWLEDAAKAVDRLLSESLKISPEDEEAIEKASNSKKPKKGESPKDPIVVPLLALKTEMKALGDYHPFAAMSSLKDESPAEIKRKLGELSKRRESEQQQNENAKRQATFYADLRDQRTLDAWYRNGNGLGPMTSPAGSFTVAVAGDRAIAGIYPAGVYSHLISDKHNATLASPYHFAKGDSSYVRMIGGEGVSRMSVRNYPLKQGLHPYDVASHETMRWQRFEKYEFWNGEQVHYQFNTSLDNPVGNGVPRSWFGVAEVIGGNAPLKNLGAPLFAVSVNASNIESRSALIEAYKQALEKALQSWKRSRMSDEEAEFLGAFVRFGFLSNSFEAFPEKLRESFVAYRLWENEIPIPTRAPGLIEGDVVDHALLKRGDPKNEAEIVPRAFLEVFAKKPYSVKHSGRLELANDIAGAANTLKTRVLVNRLWGYMFGRGLVSSTDNFGRLGKEPTHPELLDFLARDFETSGWSIKQALRQIALSRSFRSASSASEASLQLDPENLYLSHYSPRRLDAEAIMDSVNSMARDDFERGVYIKVIRNKLDPFLSAFNLPIPISTVSSRDSTNVPAQALTLLNGDFARQAARDWAEAVRNEPNLNTVEARIDALYLDAYARRPDESELEKLMAYYNRIESPEKALENIAFALLNTKEFIYVY